MNIESVDLQDDMYPQPRVAILTISSEAPEKKQYKAINFSVWLDPSHS